MWLFPLIAPPADPNFQVRSRTTATSVVPSSTDQPTSRRTPASTLERSHTNVRHAAPDLSRWEEKRKLSPSSGKLCRCWTTAQVLVFNSCCRSPPGGPSSRSRVNSHRREAVPLRDLWNALPPPSDAQEPHAHSYRREALSCKLPSQLPPFFLIHCVCWLKGE